jgi:hypothetical protein
MKRAYVNTNKTVYEKTAEYLAAMDIFLNTQLQDQYLFKISFNTSYISSLK